jgi:PAS domain S-box-containing protein
MNTPLRVLLVEDSESDAGLIIRRLQQEGYDLVHERVETAGEMRTALAKPDWDIVLADYKMPQFSASAALEILKASGRDLPFIIVSGTIGEEKAVALMKAGAHDYVMKHNLARLVPAVARELGEAEGRRERRRAEEALLQSEAALSSILRVAPIGIGLLARRVFDWTNDHLSRMTGYSCVELEGQSARMLYDLEAEFERVGEVKYAGIKQQGTGSIETRWRRKDGKVIEVFLSSTPIDPLDLDAGVVFTAVDITDRQETIKALRQSEERFRLVFEKAPIGIMHYDQTGTIIDCNEKFVEIIGAPKEKFKGFNMIQQLKDEQMRKAVAASLDGQLGYYEGDYLSVVGEKSTPVKTIFQPIFSSEGGISGGVTIFEDITGRKQAESELRLKEKLLDSASDSIFLYDLEGNFLYVNEAAYITRWYGKEELLSLGAWALGTYETAVDQDNILRELWANGELIFESEHRRKDGSVIPVEIFARVLTVEGRELILSAVRDITERKQAETREKQGLDSLRRALQGTVVALANTVEIKDPYTAGHQRRVAQLSCAMARELGWSPDRVEGIQVLCFLHDMGKIAVPAEILNKPGKISPTEFGLIKVHPQVGYDILKDIAFPWPVAQGVLQHHERLDGSGYPSGLTAGEITPEAKILAVADVVEAMASHRPYRPALEIEKAMEEITRNRGKLYDPEAVDVCLRLFTEKDFQFD